MIRRGLLILALLMLGNATQLLAQAETIVEVQVRGNGKVESDAILAIMKLHKGDVLKPDMVAEDIRTLYELGYFSDIRVFKKPMDGGVALIVQVVEKPAIITIKFEGLEELKEDDFKDKLETKLYTIVNEATITADLGVIEKQYIDKGFYLAKATYTLDSKDANEVNLVFHIEEGGKVQVGDSLILGNNFFTDTELISRMFSRPMTRASAFANPGSLFQDDNVKKDLEVLSYLYRDQGFAKVKVAKPLQVLDSDREYVRLTYQVEEGLQYYVNKIDISGDLLYTKEELLELMKLKPTGLFKFSFFQKDVDMLVDKYGDLGYAFVDVNPKTTFNDEKRTVDIDYEITKGEKVYFGKMTIIGNAKTRDNVIRREFEVHDSELYHGTGLAKSKSNIERLGFFEEVQAIKSRDEESQSILNYKFKVKEKPTGQLQAAIGFQPGQGTSQNNWFGQGRYNEENQSGKGWKTNLTGRWNGDKNYEVSAGFTDPRVNDSYWSLGYNVFLKNNEIKVTDEVNIIERRIGGSVILGRRIIELIQGSLTYKIQKVTQTSEAFLLDRFKEQGIYSSAIFGLSRNSTNNYLDPSEGSVVHLSQNFTGGPILRGNFQYQETTLDASQFIPIDFSETYRTNFRLHGVLAHIYPLGDQPVPLFERYRLGGYDDMRGFAYRKIGPTFNVLNAPGDFTQAISYGGDKKLFFQVEYFVPLIPEAGIKAVAFTDAGRVYTEDQQLELKEFYRDFGFGFRWITPIAPFRFEWAYPIIDGRPGDLQFIFYLGY